jgi:hypothetical protein
VASPATWSIQYRFTQTQHEASKRTKLCAQAAEIEVSSLATKATTASASVLVKLFSEVFKCLRTTCRRRIRRSRV